MARDSLLHVYGNLTLQVIYLVSHREHDRTTWMRLTSLPSTGEISASIAQTQYHFTCSHKRPWQTSGAQDRIHPEVREQGGHNWEGQDPAVPICIDSSPPNILTISRFTMRSTTFTMKTKPRQPDMTYLNKSPKKMTRRLENMVEMRSTKSEWACVIRGIWKPQDRHWRRDRPQDQSRIRTWCVDIIYGTIPVQATTNFIPLIGDMEWCR